MPQVLASKERGLGGPAPTSLGAAEKQLAAARRQAEAAAGAEPEEALQAHQRAGNGGRWALHTRSVIIAIRK